VAVAVSSTAALTVLPPAFKEFRESLPNAEVEFLEASLSFAYERLRDGTLDFAVANLAPGSVDDEFDINFICLMDNVIGARADNKYANSKSLRQLSEATWLVPGSAQGSRLLLSSIFEMNRLALPDHIIRCQSLTVALALMSNSDMLSVFARPLASRQGTGNRRAGMRGARNRFADRGGDSDHRQLARSGALVWPQPRPVSESGLLTPVVSMPDAAHTRS
jgi:DNA-binding transcriptional LysR family regulator